MKLWVYAKTFFRTRAKSNKLKWQMGFSGFLKLRLELFYSKNFATFFCFVSRIQALLKSLKAVVFIEVHVGATERKSPNFSQSKRDTKKQQFCLSLSPLPPIINYNHFKFSTKQLITLINTFQSTLCERASETEQKGREERKKLW